jgi:hypothetical protein
MIRSFFARIAETIKTWDEALDFSPSDYAFDRIKALESEVDYLKGELARTQPPRRFFSH